MLIVGPSWYLGAMKKARERCYVTSDEAKAQPMASKVLADIDRLPIEVVGDITEMAEAVLGLTCDTDASVVRNMMQEMIVRIAYRIYEHERYARFETNAERSARGLGPYTEEQRLLYGVPEDAVLDQMKALAV